MVNVFLTSLFAQQQRQYQQQQRQYQHQLLLSKQQQLLLSKQQQLLLSKQQQLLLSKQQLQNFVTGTALIKKVEANKDAAVDVPVNAVLDVASYFP